MQANFFLLFLMLCFSIMVDRVNALPTFRDLGKANDKSLNSLQFVQQHTDHKQKTHFRLQQYYAGFKVHGGYVIIHSNTAINIKTFFSLDETRDMNGRLYRDLEQELGKPPSDLLTNTNLALQQVLKQYQGSHVSEEEVTPLVYIDDQQKAHWAYQVSVYIHDPDKIPRRPVVIIDAQSFKSYRSWDEIKTSFVSVNGMGYGGNYKTGEYVYGRHYPNLQLTRDSESESCSMENKFVRVVDMEHGYFALDRAMKFNCKRLQEGDFYTFWTGYNADGYDLSNGAYSVTNDALYFGHVIKRMFFDWYDVEVLSKNGKAVKLVMRVHFGRNYDNAFWDNRQWSVTFGDGNSKMYPLVSLGISAHEIAHGFTQQYADLEYTGQAGAINESFSDMAAQAAEYFVSGTNSWQIGAEVLKDTSEMEAVRYLDRPSRDGTSIDSADRYEEGLDVHYASGVFNRLFYLLANMSGWNTAKAFNVMVKANMDYWIPISSFDEAGCGVINAARDLDYPVKDVKKSLKKVAINYANCGILN